MTDTAEILAYNTTTRSNADLIADAVQLGYLDLDEPILDCTYGRGVFWRRVKPARLWATDLDSDLVAQAVIGEGRTAQVADFRRLPFEDGRFNTVVFDPPYKLNGTSTGKGPSAADERYGVHTTDWSALPWPVRHERIKEGITEATRVLTDGGHLLVKCQDQVCSGQVRWQTRIFADHAESLGHRLVDRLDLFSLRRQPPGRRQVHARRNTSSLLILRLENRAQR